jgi:hypothetical protein
MKPGLGFLSRKKYLSLLSSKVSPCIYRPHQTLFYANQTKPQNYTHLSTSHPHPRAMLFPPSAQLLVMAFVIDVVSHRATSTRPSQLPQTLSPRVRPARMARSASHLLMCATSRRRPTQYDTIHN